MMLHLQTISFIISTCITVGYAFRGGYGSRWFTKTVNDYGKPPEQAHLRHEPKPVAVAPTQHPLTSSTFAPKSEYAHYPPVVDYYDPHQGNKKSYPFDAGMQNMFVFTDPVEGEPFHVSYAPPPPVQSAPYDELYMSRRNQGLDGKGGLYPDTYRKKTKQHFNSPHLNSYSRDNSFFNGLFSTRGYDQKHMGGLKDNIRNIIMDAILANLMKEWYQFS